MKKTLFLAVLLLNVIILSADPILDNDGNLINPYKHSVYGIVNDDRVNVRDSLGLSSNVIMQLNTDDPITIIKVETTPVQIGDWYNYWLQIDYMGKQGWIFGEFVSTISTDEYDAITDGNDVPSPIVYTEETGTYEIVKYEGEYLLYHLDGQFPKGTVGYDAPLPFLKYLRNGEVVYEFGIDGPASIYLSILLHVLDEEHIEIEYIEKYNDVSEADVYSEFFKGMPTILKVKDGFYGEILFTRVEEE